MNISSVKKTLTIPNSSSLTEILCGTLPILLCNCRASRPNPSGQRDRPVRFCRDALSYTVTQARSRGFIERHGVGGARSLAAQKWAPVVFETRKRRRYVDRRHLDPVQPGAGEKLQ